MAKCISGHGNLQKSPTDLASCSITGCLIHQPWSRRFTGRRRVCKDRSQIDCFCGSCQLAMRDPGNSSGETAADLAYLRHNYPHRLLFLAHPGRGIALEAGGFAKISGELFLWQLARRYPGTAEKPRIPWSQPPAAPSHTLVAALRWRQEGLQGKIPDRLPLWQLASGHERPGSSGETATDLAHLSHNHLLTSLSPWSRH